MIERRTVLSFKFYLFVATVLATVAVFGSVSLTLTKH
jgi:hypothetical protein